MAVMASTGQPAQLGAATSGTAISSRLQTVHVVNMQAFRGRPTCPPFLIRNNFQGSPELKLLDAASSLAHHNRIGAFRDQLNRFVL